MDPSQTNEKIIQGIAASPGIVFGKVFLLREKELKIPRYKVTHDQKDHEIRRFEKALVDTRVQIQQIQSEISGKLKEEEARIFDAHLMVLEDEVFINECLSELETKLENIESCVYEVGQRFVEAFDQIDDEYLRERASDIRDVLRRILSNLTGQTLSDLGTLVKDHILVSRDIAPSESASIDKTFVLGILTDVGSKTSHAVILARSLNIPAVVGLGDITSILSHDEEIIIDGYEGRVIVNASEETVKRYRRMRSDRESLEEQMRAVSQKDSETLDGHRIKLMANIEQPEEVEKAVEMGADGVGLFRTEYLYLATNSIPSEETQFQAYKKSVELSEGGPVVIRTLDIGGDKFMSSNSSMPSAEESNPFLGHRAIRYCIDNPDVFLSQLRAILRASVFGDIKLLYPMISGSKELKRANKYLKQAKESLKSEGIEYDENLEVGTMIEIPSAAFAADLLAADSSFFSIGTNDLIQYLLAVDRLNDKVAHLYQPTHPAVLRTLKHIVKCAKDADIEVSICGEMASDPMMVPLIIGLGISCLSMSPTLLPNVKFVVQNMKMSEAVELAEEALQESDETIVMDRLIKFYTEKMSSLY